MLIQTLPPRLILRVIAIRAASIWRLVTQPCSIALRPYSPNWTRVPPLAMPRRRPRCGLRDLVRLGSSTTTRLLQGRHRRREPPPLAPRPPLQTPRAPAGAPSAPRPRGTAAAATPPGTAATASLGPRRSELLGIAGAAAATAARVHLTQPGAGGVALEALGHDLALVDPDLDADPAERRLGLGEAVVDVGAQRVQRHTTLAVLLGARHLGATQAAAAAD